MHIDKRLFVLIKKLLPILMVVMYIFISCLRITLPGVNYDEIFFGNAALGVIDPSTFIEAHFHGIPILIIPYIGALKAYLYFPIFKIFGVSVLTLRLPIILISALSLYLLHKTLKTYLNGTIASLSLLLLIFDPSYIVHSRLDFGPVVLSFLLRVLALFFFIKYLKSKDKKNILWVFISLSLGFFNKFDYIWFISSFVLSAILFYRNDTVNRLFKNKLLVKYVSLVSIILVLFLVFIFSRFHFFTSISFPSKSHISNIFVSYGNLINGSSFYEFMIGDLPQLPGQIFTLTTIVIITLTIIFRKTILKKTERQYLFITVILVGIIMQELLTNKAGASWHLFMTYPFTTILLAISIHSIYLMHKQSVLRYIMSFIVISIISYQISLSLNYVSHYDTNLRNINWSPAIYELIDYTKKTNAHFYSIDWGIHNQLVVFNQEKGKYTDRWLQLNKSNIKDESITNLFGNKESIVNSQFILHTQANSEFKRSRSNFFLLLKNNNLRAIKIKSIKYNSMDIFELYKVKNDS